MNFHDLIKRINEKTIEIDFQGHLAVNHLGTDIEKNPYFKRAFEEINEYYEDTNNMANGGNDGNWNKDGKEEDNTPEKIKEWDLRMRAHYQYNLGMFKTKNGFDLSWRFYDGINCYYCGSKLFWFYNPEKDNIVISDTYKTENIFRECKHQIDGPTKGIINIDSDFIIANWFKEKQEDAPEGKKYSNEYGINYPYGRKNVTKWKVQNQNVAYGQMGNMSLAVYLNKTKDHIVLCCSYIEDLEEDEQIFYKFLEAYDHIGDISLSIWRWEATDIKTLGITDVKSYEKDKGYNEFYIFPIKHGKWEFIHYYDYDQDSKIYAEFKLI